VVPFLLRTEVHDESWLTKSLALGACGFDLDAESEVQGERVELVCLPGTRTKGDERNPTGGGARRTAAGSIPPRWWCSGGLDARVRHGIERGGQGDQVEQLTGDGDEAERSDSEGDGGGRPWWSARPSRVAAIRRSSGVGSVLDRRITSSRVYW
jgi:hypothetical protein